MTSVSITDLYDILSTKVGKEEAKALTNYIEAKIEKDVDDKTRYLASREDSEKGFKDQSRWMLGIFITLTLMILGLYATILLR